MKNIITKTIIAFLIFNLHFTILNAQISINENGSSPDSSAILDVSSPDKGMLIPRMSSTAREAITNPAAGLMVYDTKTQTFWYFDNNQWNEIGKAQETVTPPFENPSLTSVMGFGSFNRTMLLDGDILYVVQDVDTKLRAIDVSDASNPTILSELNLSNTFNTSDIAIKENYIYLPYYTANGGGGIIVVDISNPSAMTFNNISNLNGSYSNGYREGNILYVMDNVTGELILYDITNAANPTIINSITGFPYSSNSYQGALYVENNIAYIIHTVSTTVGTGKLSVVDVNDIQNLSILSTISSPTFSPDNGYDKLILKKHQDYLFLAGTDGSNRGDVIDVSDLTNPSIVGKMMHTNLSYSTAFDITSNYLYTIDYGSFPALISIQDITAPTNHQLVYSQQLPTAQYGDIGSSTIIDKDKVYFLLTDGLLIYQIGSEYVEVTYPDGSTSLEQLVDDNLGNHTASENIKTNGFYISNDGNNEGVFIDNNGQVGIGTNAPSDYLEVPLSTSSSNQLKMIANINDVDIESIATAWQSYTATVDGTLGIIDIPSSGFASRLWTITIYAGEGTSGIQLGTLTANNVYDFSSLNIPQIADSIYTFSVSIANGQFDPFSNSSYSGGISSFGQNIDFSFDLFINANVSGTFSVGSNGVKINNYQLPLFDGTSNQVLQSNGNGTVSWANNIDNDNQELTLSNDVLSISGGTNTIDLSGYSNTDNQELTLSNDVLSISGGFHIVDFSGYNQELTFSNNVLSISGGTNTVDLSGYSNTDDQELTLSNDVLSISGGTNTVDLSGYSNTDNQELTLSNDVLSISGNSTTVDLSDYEQELTLNNNTLSISGGNSVNLSSIVPIGTIQMWPTNNPPAGWLICNGATFNASTYADLSAVLGGNTLPNSSGRFPLGVGNSGTSGSSTHNLTNTGGEEKHSLTVDEMPSHSHGAGSLTTSEPYLSQNGSGTQDKRDGGDDKLYGYNSITGSTASVGGNQAHNNMPPFYTINFIIKAE